MSMLLKDRFYHEYFGKGPNLTLWGSEVTHLTIHSNRSHVRVFAPNPKNRIIGRRSYPATLHVYDIVKNAFVLELRNIPMSVAIERLILQKEGKREYGQTHSTVRLTLRQSDAPWVRELAESVRRVPKEGRTDRFSESGSAADAVCQALLKLAGVLETSDLRDVEKAAAEAVPKV